MLKIHASPGSIDSSRKFESTESGSIQFLNGLSRAFLIAAIVVAPWLFGGYDTHFQLGLYVAVAVALIFRITASLIQASSKDSQPSRIPTVFLPLLGLALLTCSQLLPSLRMPPAESIQSAVESAATRSTEETERWQLSRIALVKSLQTGGTIAPAATRFELMRLIVVITVFFLGSQLFAASSSQPWLWGAMAINGAALSFFGICQQLSWNDKLFWTFALKFGGSPFSAFVNRNNAAGYLCLCLAAAIGWLIYTFSQSSVWSSSYERDDYRPVYSRSWLANLSDAINELTFPQMVSTTAVFLIATGVILAMSRGGWLALGCATFATVVITNPNRRGRNLILALGVAAMIALLVGWAGIGDRLRQRWHSMPSTETIYREGRFGHWSDAVKIIPDFPLMGTGFGTYQYAYLPYQTHPELATLRFYHADNQFLEWAVEGGAIGIFFVALSLLSTGALIFALCRNRLEPSGTVGVFAFVSQIVSASFDFGPTMPANMLAISAIFGAIAGRASLLVQLEQLRYRGWGLTLPPLRPQFLMTIAGIGLLLFNCLGLKEVQAAAKTHLISRNLPTLNAADDLDEAKVDQLIQELSEATKSYPDDPEAHLGLADLWIYKFRLKDFQARKELEGDDGTLWPQTHPAFQYLQYNRWHAAEQFEMTSMFLENVEIQNCLRPAREHLLQAIRACALTPDVASLLATLQFVETPDTPSGEGYLRRTLTLGPSSPFTFFQTGQIAGFGELTSLSHACWKQSLQFSPQFLREIHSALATQLSIEEELEQVIPPTGETLLQLARLYQNANEIDQRRSIALKAVDAFSKEPDGPGKAKSLRLTAEAYTIAGMPDEAIHSYRKALELAPHQIEWRMELVKLLQSTQGVQWALREAETCVALAPEHVGLRKLVDELKTKLLDEQSSTGTTKAIH